MTDADYLLAFMQIIMPIAYEFNPELVVFIYSTHIKRLYQQASMPASKTRLDSVQSPLNVSAN